MVARYSKCFSVDATLSAFSASVRCRLARLVSLRLLSRSAVRHRCFISRLRLQAMLLINDLELVDSADYFETRLKAGGVLDVAEKYPWTGEMVLLDSPGLTAGDVLEPESTTHPRLIRPA